MPNPIGYQRDSNGHFVAPGQTVQVFDQSFLLGGALPSWLVTSNATGAVGTPAADVGAVAIDASNDGYYRVGTSVASTANGDVAALVGPTLYTSRIKAAHFEVMGLSFSDDAGIDSLTAAVQIGIRNVGTASAGGAAGQFSADATAQYRTAGVSGNVDAFYRMRTAYEAARKRHLGFLLIPGSKEMYLTEGGIDNVVSFHREAGMADGAVRPLLAITASEAVRKTLRFSRVRLTVWQH
jgi:hypothetical protein